MSPSTRCREARRLSRHQAVPVQRVDLAYLDEAKIDWAQYSWWTPEVMVPLGPKQLRPHQQRALADVVSGLETHDRGKLLMACGIESRHLHARGAKRHHPQLEPCVGQSPASSRR